MKKIIRYITLLYITVIPVTSCSDYLNIVPDNIPTIEQVFNTREGAFQMLYTCYDYVPRPANIFHNPALLVGDEVWNPVLDPTFYYYRNKSSEYIAKGKQNKINPLMDYWDGGNYNYLNQKFGDTEEGLSIKSLWAGIRNCNIMIENIHSVPDMKMEEKDQWKAEVRVLKAYYHYYLMQLYGPIPYMSENLPISLPADQVQVEREPVDIVVNKIVEELDIAIDSEALPETVAGRGAEMGRINLAVAKAIKAKVLILAASPMFNGNNRFLSLKNAQGTTLFNPEYSVEKWQRAALACADAIQAAENASMGFYKFKDKSINVSDKTMLELDLRGQITDKTSNPELVWGIGRQDVRRLIYYASSPLNQSQIEGRPLGFNNLHAPTMNIVDQFYTRNGLPLDEDKDYAYEDRFKLVSVTDQDEHYFNPDKEIRVPYYNTQREPRFYAYLGFDQGKYFCQEQLEEDKTYIIHSKANDFAGIKNMMYTVTGYTCKKIVPWDRQYVTNKIDNIGDVLYFFPIIRYSDLCLMYAEALNESKDAPDNDVYFYINAIRAKSGLDTNTGGIVQTWTKYSKNPNKPKTKEGMREIIRQERMIELSFEGQRFWDLKRWMLATEYYNKPIRGWNVFGFSENEYYKETYIYPLKFSTRDYFWPIKQSSIDSNYKLQQNQGW